MAGINISETAMIHYNKQISDKFIQSGNQLRPILGTKWKVTTQGAGTINFLVSTEANSSLKPALGSLAVNSTAGKMVTVKVMPVTYVVNTFIDEIELDSTTQNIQQELVDIHANAMALRTDMTVLEAIKKAVYLTKNKFTGIDLTKYDASNWLKITAQTAAVGGARTKYLIVDSVAHAKLLANEKFINGDYGTSGVVEGGSLNGKVRLGYKILLLDDLDEEFHKAPTLMAKLGITNKCYIITEESLCAGAHRDSLKTWIERQLLIYNDYIIQTHMSLAVKVLQNRGMYEIEYI